MENMRQTATIKVGGVDYTKTLANATPPTVTWEPGSIPGQGANIPTYRRFNLNEWTFNTIGDHKELNNMVDNLDVSYTEHEVNQFDAETQRVTYEVSGRLTTEPSQYAVDDAGFPLVAHTMQPVKYRKMYDSEVVTDIDMTVYPPKAINMGKDMLAGASTAVTTPPDARPNA